MIGLVQEASSQQDFEEYYPTRTEIMQAVPMLVENVVMVDKHRRQRAQMNRRMKESDAGELKRKISGVGKVQMLIYSVNYFVIACVCTPSCLSSSHRLQWNSFPASGTASQDLPRREPKRGRAAVLV